MKRKRFVKLMMANGHDRNNANKLADMYKGERREQLIADFKVIDDLMRNYATNDIMEVTSMFVVDWNLHFARGNGKSQQTLERIVQLVED